MLEKGSGGSREPQVLLAQSFETVRFYERRLDEIKSYPCGSEPVRKFSLELFITNEAVRPLFLWAVLWKRRRGTQPAWLSNEARRRG